ncbi:Ank2 [Symbiodinium sp. CCMP2592]|nr:Ank2 [Symbiodinium sp. CCMP2592]
MASQHHVPWDVYQDSLSEYLIRSAYESLLQQQGVEFQPLDVSMLSYNDILAHAARILRADLMQQLYRYSADLSESMPALPGPALPMSLPLPPGPVAPAEQYAYDLLNGGACSLWSALRMAINLIQFEPARHGKIKNQPGAMSFSLGAFSRTCFVGICRNTLRYPNLCRLVNRYIIHTLPEHHWTSVAIHWNCQLPLHRDHGNGPVPNALFSLSAFEGGDIWIQSEEGSEYQEVSGQMLRGKSWKLHDAATVFPAHTAMHGTTPWRREDRVTMVAYCIRNYYSLDQSFRTQLEELGFCSPPAEMMTTRFPPQILPPVLYDD